MKLRWGILGTGFIAGVLAKAMRQCPMAELVAVGSRSQASAERFGQEHGIERRHPSYEALLADPDIDAVYISLPNHLHAPWTLACLQAGKHVLCEKPIALSANEAKTVFAAAAKARRLVMEAFMYRFHPSLAKMAQMVREGAIGKLRLIHASFGFNRDLTGDCRLNPAWGGGGIMDVGCYTVSAARLIAGAAMGKPFANPLSVVGAAHIDPASKVDLWATGSLKFERDILASMNCGMQAHTDWRLEAHGSEGALTLENPWLPHMPNHALTHRAKDGQPAPVPTPAADNVYVLELNAFAEHAAQGQPQPPAMTWDDSLGNMATLDAWRAAVGLAF